MVKDHLDSETENILLLLLLVVELWLRAEYRTDMTTHCPWVEDLPWSYISLLPVVELWLRAEYGTDMTTHCPWVELHLTHTSCGALAESRIQDWYDNSLSMSGATSHSYQLWSSGWEQNTGLIWQPIAHEWSYISLIPVVELWLRAEYRTDMTTHCPWVELHLTPTSCGALAESRIRDWYDNPLPMSGATSHSYQLWSSGWEQNTGLIWQLIVHEWSYISLLPVVELWLRAQYGTDMTTHCPWVELHLTPTSCGALAESRIRDWYDNPLSMSGTTSHSYQLWSSGWEQNTGLIWQPIPHEWSYSHSTQPD